MLAVTLPFTRFSNIKPQTYDIPCIYFTYVSVKQFHTYMFSHYQHLPSNNYMYNRQLFSEDEVAVHPLNPKSRKVFVEVNIKRGKTGEGIPTTEINNKKGSLGSGNVHPSSAVGLVNLAFESSEPSSTSNKSDTVDTVLVIQRYCCDAASKSFKITTSIRINNDQ